MSLQPIETPTASIKTVLNTLAQHAQANPSDDVILINATTATDPRESLEGINLGRHLECHGREAELATHDELMRIQGWTHFVSEGVSWWAVRRDMPDWIMPHYLLPRCLNCARNSWFECRCNDRGPTGKKLRRESVYVLELKTPGHFYVGRTFHPESRMEAHVAGHGCPWTSLHPPVRIRALQRVWKSLSQKIEDQTTRDLMAVFGTSVRGGYYISDEQARRVFPRCGLLTRQRGPTIAPPDPRIWSRWDIAARCHQRSQ